MRYTVCSTVCCTFCYTFRYTACYTVYCTISYTVCSTVSYTFHYTVCYTVRYTVRYIVRYTIRYTICCTVSYTVRYTVRYTVCCTVWYSVRYTICCTFCNTARYTVCFTFCYTVRCTVYAFIFICVRKWDICGGRELAVCARTLAVLGLVCFFSSLKSQSAQHNVYLIIGTFAQRLSGRCSNSPLFVCRRFVLHCHLSAFHKILFGGGWGELVRKLYCNSLTKTTY